jgi:hypothetical protein
MEPILKKIRARKEIISKTVQEIIRGIQKYLLEETKTSNAHNWYKKAKNMSFDFGKLFIAIQYIEI